MSSKTIWNYPFKKRTKESEESLRGFIGHYQADKYTHMGVQKKKKMRGAPEQSLFQELVAEIEGWVRCRGEHSDSRIQDTKKDEPKESQTKPHQR